MKSLPLATMALVSILTLPAHAVTVYTLTETQTAGLGSGPFGTVTLTQNGLTEVDVMVRLAPGYEFVQTGGKHDAFTFNLPDLSGYVVGAIVAAPSSTKTYSWDSSGSNPAFGSFSDALNCGDCRRGARGAFATQLSFAVTNADGILKRDFTANSKGFYFSADILRTATGATGAVGAVPEPHTAALMFIGLLGIGAYRRRLKR